MNGVSPKARLYSPWNKAVYIKSIRYDRLIDPNTPYNALVGGHYVDVASHRIEPYGVRQVIGGEVKWPVLLDHFTRA